MADFPQTDEQRFVEIVNAHRAGLLAYAARLTGGDGARAEDIVQETFVRAWVRIDRLTPEFGSVNNWLRRVTYNLAVDGYRIRRNRPSDVSFDDVDRATPEDQVDDLLLGLVVQDLLAEIWPKHREVLTEVYLKDRTTAQAAKELGLPLGTVKSRIYYALRAMRGPVENSGLRAAGPLPRTTIPFRHAAKEVSLR